MWPSDPALTARFLSLRTLPLLREPPQGGNPQGLPHLALLSSGLGQESYSCPGEGPYPGGPDRFEELQLDQGEPHAVRALPILLQKSGATADQEYSRTMTQFFPQLFLAFITQVHYVLELGLREDQKQEARKPIVPSNLGPWR
ncbi:maestro heat-like repeat family member 5 [Ornithorhynchus anatinus]|nr:maestro heat-like repeat family member 5 [Ornithorhynchus anatinus]